MYEKPVEIRSPITGVSPYLLGENLNLFQVSSLPILDLNLIAKIHKVRGKTDQIENEFNSEELGFGRSTIEINDDEIVFRFIPNDFDYEGILRVSIFKSPESINIELKEAQEIITFQDPDNPLISEVWVMSEDSEKFIFTRTTRRYNELRDIYRPLEELEVSVDLSNNKTSISYQKGHTEGVSSLSHAQTPDKNSVGINLSLPITNPDNEVLEQIREITILNPILREAIQADTSLSYHLLLNAIYRKINAKSNYQNNSVS